MCYGFFFTGNRQHHLSLLIKMSANESLANLSSESDSPNHALQGDSMPVTASSHDENESISNKQGEDTERGDVDMDQETDTDGSMKSDDSFSVETRDKQRLHNGCSRCHPTKHVEGVVYCKTCDLCLCDDHRNVSSLFIYVFVNAALANNVKRFYFQAFRYMMSNGQ